MIRLILASASPRRSELMKQAGYEFDVMPAKGAEDAGSRMPKDAVRYLSKQKAKEIAIKLCGEERDEDMIVIGADTVVAIDGAILGKPADRTDASKMLHMLSGRTHEVFTGVTLLKLPAGTPGTNPERLDEASFVECTEVDFARLSDDEIEAYISSGESDDKAGAYGIQGRFAVHVTGIRGDYFNVVGLPLAALYKALKNITYRNENFS
ncbi:MAG: Maf family protein [Lachnospiraceae bacterium]|nr:Maf family protein [Lachnospiraceae bacterium]